MDSRFLNMLSRSKSRILERRKNFFKAGHIFGTQVTKFGRPKKCLTSTKNTRQKFTKVLQKYKELGSLTIKKRQSKKFTRLLKKSLLILRYLKKLILLKS